MVCMYKKVSVSGRDRAVSEGDLRPGVSPSDSLGSNNVKKSYSADNLLDKNRPSQPIVRDGLLETNVDEQHSDNGFDLDELHEENLPELDSILVSTRRGSGSIGNDDFLNLIDNQDLSNLVTPLKKEHSFEESSFEEHTPRNSQSEEEYRDDDQLSPLPKFYSPASTSVRRLSNQSNQSETSQHLSPASKKLYAELKLGKPSYHGSRIVVRDVAATSALAFEKAEKTIRAAVEYRTGLHTRIQELDARLIMVKKDLQDKQYQLDQLSADYLQLEQDYDDKKHAFDNLEKKLELSRQQLLKADKTHASLKKLQEKLVQQCTALSAQLKDLESEREKLIAENRLIITQPSEKEQVLEKQLLEMRQKYETLSKEKGQLRQALATAKEENVEKNGRLQQAEGKCKELELRVTELTQKNKDNTNIILRQEQQLAGQTLKLNELMSLLDTDSNPPSAESPNHRVSVTFKNESSDDIHTKEVVKEISEESEEVEDTSVLTPKGRDSLGGGESIHRNGTDNLKQLQNAKKLARLAKLGRK